MDDRIRGTGPIRVSVANFETVYVIRLVFGLKPASLISTYCHKQLAVDEKERFPLAFTLLKRDSYVDHLLSGANTRERAEQ